MNARKTNNNPFNTFRKKKKQQYFLLSFRYGRKIPMMFAIVLLLVAGVGTSLAPWYELFLPLRFATALAIGGLMISSFVLSKCCAQ